MRLSTRFDDAARYLLEFEVNELELESALMPSDSEFVKVCDRLGAQGGTISFVQRRETYLCCMVL